MALIEINFQPSKRELRQFAGIWFPAMFAVIGFFVHKATGAWTIPGILWGIAAVISVVGFCVPAFMRPIFVGWMVAAFPIGWTISHVMMAAIYYLVVTPLGLVMRVAGYDPMHRKFDTSAATYWIPRTQSNDAKRYFQQF